jgi:hypothetical protein
MDSNTILEIADIITAQINGNETIALETKGYIDSDTDLKNEELHNLRSRLIAMHQTS